MIKTSIFRRSFFAVALTLAAFAITGCDKKIEGKYMNDNGDMSVEFKPGGKAVVNVVGGSVTGDYVEEKEKVTVTLDKHSTIFTRNADGTLTSPQMGTLKKKI